jgi:hypothetical protein
MEEWSHARSVPLHKTRRRGGDSSSSSCAATAAVATPTETQCSHRRTSPACHLAWRCWCELTSPLLASRHRRLDLRARPRRRRRTRRQQQQLRQQRPCCLLAPRRQQACRCPTQAAAHRWHSCSTTTTSSSSSLGASRCLPRQQQPRWGRPRLQASRSCPQQCPTPQASWSSIQPLPSSTCCPLLATWRHRRFQRPQTALLCHGTLRRCSSRCTCCLQQCQGQACGSTHQR